MRPKRYVDITGKQFGHLTVVRYDTTINGISKWICRCECGDERSYWRNSLTRGKDTISCGCLRDCTNPTHGMTYTPEYQAWQNMKARCYQLSTKHYNSYGGRGIKVCDRWLDSFENFFEDMGKKPSKKASLDRIDVDGDYCPENCRWASSKNQARNKRHTIYLTSGGNTKTMSDWADELGVRANTLMCRYLKGWSDERIVTEPVNKNGRWYNKQGERINRATS